MKASNRLSAICLVLFLANFVFVAAQVKTDATGKTLSETPATAGNSKPSDDLTSQIAANKNLTGEIYRIGFRDTVEVSVGRHPELSQTTGINSDGTIRMPRIKNSIPAVCKTENELREIVENNYKSYLRDPYVTVRVVQKMSQPYGVIGAVQKPGSFYLDRNINLLELLTLAGGPNVEFAGSKIQVARIGGIIGCAETSEAAGAEDRVKFMGYSLSDVQQGKVNPVLQPGDIVSVLIAEKAYVVGNVLKPTEIILNEPKSLTQAIAVAGGIDKTADTKKVIIQRYDSATGIKTELSFNLKDIREQKIPDPQLQANDIVQVYNDKTKSLTKGFIDVFKSNIPTVLRPY